jgi:arylsulfatase
VRVDDWKLVGAAGEPWELYDLKTDRAEQQNLAAALPQQVRELERVWQRQADSFTELVKKTLASQPRPKGGQGKAKDKSK